LAAQVGAARRLLREEPAGDGQLSLFVPVIYDAPLNDVVNLMDMAPFTISSDRRNAEIRYVHGSAEHGLATSSTAMSSST
jgi:hypothetical protein